MAKVPILAIPFFADQFWNADRIKNLGIGESYTLKNFDEQVFQKLIENLISNDR